MVVVASDSLLLVQRDPRAPRPTGRRADGGRGRRRSRRLPATGPTARSTARSRTHPRARALPARSAGRAAGAAMTGAGRRPASGLAPLTLVDDAADLAGDPERSLPESERTVPLPIASPLPSRDAAGASRPVERRRAGRPVLVDVEGTVHRPAFRSGRPGVRHLLRRRRARDPVLSDRRPRRRIAPGVRINQTEHMYLSQSSVGTVLVGYERPSTVDAPVRHGNRGAGGETASPGVSR